MLFSFYSWEMTFLPVCIYLLGQNLVYLPTDTCEMTEKSLAHSYDAEKFDITIHRKNTKVWNHLHTSLHIKSCEWNRLGYDTTANIDWKVSCSANLYWYVTTICDKLSLVTQWHNKGVDKISIMLYIMTKSQLTWNTAAKQRIRI